MAIKDQCEQCRIYKVCSETNEFNGMTCPNYSRRINLTKAEDNTTSDKFEENKTEVVSPLVELPDPNQSIKGWLVFFLCSIGLGGVISAVFPIFTYNVSEYGESHFFAIGDVVLGVLLLALSCYTIYSFSKRKPNAVFLGKMYVIIVFATNVISLIGGEFETTGLGSLTQVVRGLIWCVVWYLYLTFSTQVKEIIPKSYRKVFNRDYYIIAAFVVVPLLFIGLGIGELTKNNQESEAEFIATSNLAYNEYTDSRMIFTKPLGFTCEKYEIENPKITIFNLEYNDEATVTICSDYDSDISASNFNFYWKNWNDESLEGVKYQEIINEKKGINGNPYYIKSVKYHTENPLRWHFVLLFNTKTGKVCVVSYYHIEGHESRLNELLESIRF
jgi:hypothetical protein